MEERERVGSLHTYLLLESEYMCREGTMLQTEMCTIDTYMVVASSCGTLDLDMNSRAYICTRIKVGEKGEREGVRKAEREGRRVGGRKAHVTLNSNALGCNMYS